MRFIEVLRIAFKVYQQRKALATLININVAVSCVLWLWMLVSALFNLPRDILFSLLALPASPETALMHPWTFLTYMFLQYSPFHLLFNMLTLFWFGAEIYDSGRPCELPKLYVFCGILAALSFLAYTFFEAHARHGVSLPLAGASGSVIGIIVFSAMRAPRKEFLLFGVFKAYLWQIAAIIVGISLISGISENVGGIVAHCGGVAAGCLAFFIMARNRQNKPRTVNKIKLRPVADPELRLDELLEKISTSGYESLSETEKNELLFITTRLNNNNKK